MLEEAVARRFLRQVLETVIACHERGVIHRDIKDENILVNVVASVPEIQLIDFGSGAHISSDVYTDFDGKKLSIAVLKQQLGRKKGKVLLPFPETEAALRQLRQGLIHGAAE